MISRSLKKKLFNVYLNVPGSQYFFLAIRKIMIPTYHWRKYFRFKGVFKLVIDETLQLKIMSYGNTIENELFWLGAKGWEGRAIQAWKKLSERSSVIFDIGANTGLYSLVSAKVNTLASVYAFEPLQPVVERFRINLQLNDLVLNLFQVALAEEDGEGKIFMADTISGTFDQASLNELKYQSVTQNFFTIRKRTLSSFIEENNITHIDLMKIDVETFEPQVLRGMRSYLKRFAPTLIIEILNEKVGRQVQDLIQDIEYHYYLIDEKKGFILKDSLLPNKRGNNFLILNKNKHPNFDLKLTDVQ